VDTVFWSGFTLEIPQDSDFRSGASGHFSVLVVSLIMGKHHRGEKEKN